MLGGCGFSALFHLSMRATQEAFSPVNRHRTLVVAETAETPYRAVPDRGTPHMARKPKTQPSPEAAAPARRGRKPKAAPLSSALPLAADVGDPAPGDAERGVPQAGPTKVPSRRGRGRKPKQASGAEIAPAVSDDAAAPQGQAPHQPEAEASPDVIGDDAPIAAASQAEAAADSNPVQPNLDPSTSANEAPQPFPKASASVPARPAAHWDRTTDQVRFNWPVIERVAAQAGPNQGMAKLLVAARAEGAQSRWPF